MPGPTEWAFMRGGLLPAATPVAALILVVTAAIADRTVICSTVPRSSLLRTLVCIVNKGSSMKLSTPQKLVYPAVVVGTLLSATLWAERSWSQPVKAPAPPAVNDASIAAARESR
jgi:hypothetical protein